MVEPELVIGNGGKVIAGDLTVNVSHWSCKRSSRLQDTTDSGTLSWARWKGSVREAEGSAKAFWDASSPPETALGLEEGSEVTLSLYIGDSQFYENFKAVIADLSIDVDNQTGYVQYDFNFKSSGPVALFGG